MLSIVDYTERATRLSAILERRGSFSEEIAHSVREIVDDVRTGRDRAVADYTERFDAVRPQLRVPPEACGRALSAMDGDLRAIIEEAAANIRRFHERQRQESWFIEEEDGVLLGQRVLPLERVGLYVPGSTAFYPSSLLMNAIPAHVAGVSSIHLVSPPMRNGTPHPLVLATAHLLGIESVFAVGGAQAIAALAFGTETIPRVDKIVGPGNAYVAAAKRMVYGSVDIDSIAGPSEIVVLADSTADADFVAADMLSQAEHDVRASAILVTPDRVLAKEVAAAVADRIEALPRKEIALRSLSEYGACVVTDSMEQAVAMVNELAPEHLELLVADPWSIMNKVRSAGAIFMGPYSPEPVGDYFAGPNHVLPTGGTARFASPLGVQDFLKRQSIIAYTRQRLLKDGPKIVRFAEAEELAGHAQAIQLRLDRES